MPRNILEVFQSRLESTQDLLNCLALLSDETLKEITRTAVPAEIVAQYRGIIEAMHRLAYDASKLAETAAQVTPEDCILLQ